MAVRLAGTFGGSIEGWLTQQLQTDLAPISKKAPAIEVNRYVPA